MRACVTMSLVAEARGGPFILWEDLATSCRRASEWGFTGVEIFAPDAAALEPSTLAPRLAECQLQLVALGTGAGWLRHQLTLTSADPERRAAARQFVRSIIERAAEFGAATIIGSMQGRWNEAVSREEALRYLGEALHELGNTAHRLGTTLLYEPLNRYETNLLQHVGAAATFVRSLDCPALQVLADLFHMNLEEVDLANALLAVGDRLGHVHFVDSNRRAAGFGHLAFGPIFQALTRLAYRGWLSVEGLPWPNAEAAARQTLLAVDYWQQHVSATPLG